MEKDAYDVITSVGTAIAAIAACWAAFEAKLAARISSRYSEADLLSRLLDEYASTEMHRAIDALLDWEDQNKGEYKKILDQIHDPSTSPGSTPLPARDLAQWSNITEQRRKIYYFFLRAYVYWKDGLLVHSSMEKLTQLTAYPLLHRLVRPLTEIVYEVDEPAVWTRVGDKKRTDWVDELTEQFPPGPGFVSAPPAASERKSASVS